MSDLTFLLLAIILTTGMTPQRQVGGMTPQRQVGGMFGSLPQATPQATTPQFPSRPFGGAYGSGVHGGYPVCAFHLIMLFFFTGVIDIQINGCPICSFHYGCYLLHV